MKISYYPGCTLKTKAKNLEDSALASLHALGIDVEELDRWNCCGAVYSLADDDLIHQVAPVRDLIRARDQGADKVVTLCSQCYNVLARANLLMRNDEVKRKTLNDFMYEESDYAGEVDVVHYLDVLKDDVGWDKLKAAVKNPLKDLKVAPFYGCTLLRPKEVAVAQGGPQPTVMREFLLALGATPIEYSEADECCGAYEVMINPVEGEHRASKVLLGAQRAGAEALILSCPLCEYNLGKKQDDIARSHSDVGHMPVYYFTQLLAVALGLGEEAGSFTLNVAGSRQLLQDRKFIAAGGA